MFNASSTLDYFTTDGYDLIRDDLLKTVNPYFNLTYRTRNSYQINNKNIVSFRGHYFYQSQDNTSYNQLSLLEGKLQ